MKVVERKVKFVTTYLRFADGGWKVVSPKIDILGRRKTATG